jgi:hypothetical protein
MFAALWPDSVERSHIDNVWLVASASPDPHEADSRHGMIAETSGAKGGAESVLAHAASIAASAATGEVNPLSL